MSMIDYRKDIDGLRSVAILLVIIFHAFPNKLPGGFIGVDVFFVISGFLISKIIISSFQKKSFSILDFYGRRIRRIFPALIVALTLTLAIGWFTLFASEYKNLAKHTLGAIGFVSNLIIWSESGYFDVSSKLKPLLNLWSLGVEEQFYLFWPLLIGLSIKTRKSLFYLISGFFVLSFFANVILIKGHSSLVFYNPLTRFWELAAGGALAYLEIYKVGFVVQIRQKVHLTNAFSTFGLLLILFFSTYLNEHSIFPGYYALAPVLGSFLILSAGEKALMNRVLSYKAFVFIGLISYPLYLFHWPLLSIANILYNQNPPNLVIFVVLALTTFLACWTYFKIELPIKENRKLKYASAKLNVILVGEFCLIGILAIIIYVNDGFNYRLRNLESLVQTKLEYRDSLDSEESKKCREKNFDIEMCVITNPLQNPTIALIGDSHANHFFPALESYYREKSENLILLARSGVAPFLSITSKREGSNSLDDVIKKISSDPYIHTVILAGFWSNYFNEEGTQTGDVKYKNVILDNDKNLTKQSEVFEKGLKQTITTLMLNRKKVIFIHDIFSVPFYINQCANRSNLNYFSETASFKECTFDKVDAQKDQAGYKKSVEQILKDFPELIQFDPTPSLCDEKKCFVVKDNHFLYSDEHHLSLYGVSLLLHNFHKSISPKSN